MESSSVPLPDLTTLDVSEFDLSRWPEKAPRPPIPARDRRLWDNETYEQRYVRKHSTLLDVARDLATERGRGNIQVADIVAAAAVSKREFYEHFSSKDDCLAQVLGRSYSWFVGKMIAAADSIVATCTTPHQALVSLIAREHRDVARDAQFVIVLRTITATGSPAVVATQTDATKRYAWLYATLGRRLGSPLDDSDLIHTSVMIRYGIDSTLAYFDTSKVMIERLARLWLRSFAIDGSLGAADAPQAGRSAVAARK
jgi:AcrR family transcriptional regulator